MGQWLPNLNSKSRRRSKRPARVPNPPVAVTSYDPHAKKTEVTK